MSVSASTGRPADRLAALGLDADEAHQLAFDLGRTATDEEIRDVVTRKAAACWELAEIFLDREGCADAATEYIERAELLEAVSRRFAPRAEVGARILS